MPSKREGLIQPSVTSQPPRLTARTGRPLSGTVLPFEEESMQKQAMEKMMTNLFIAADDLVFFYVGVIAR